MMSWWKSSSVNLYAVHGILHYFLLPHHDCVWTIPLAFQHQCLLCLGAAWGGWHWESSLNLLVPARSWQWRAPGGLSGCHQQGFIGLRGFNAISSGLQAHTNAWYAHMIVAWVLSTLVVITKWNRIRHIKRDVFGSEGSFQPLYRRRRAVSLCVETCLI